MESYKLPDIHNCDLMCPPCPAGTIRTTPPASGGCQEECPPCICPTAPKCAPPNCNNPLPSPVDDQGCVTGCPDCPMDPDLPGCPEFSCAPPRCNDPVSPPPGEDGCATGCPVCDSDDEPTCNLVELCDPEQNDCFRALSCDDRNGDDKYVLVEYCDSSDCIISSENDIPLQPCNSKDCVAVESTELDYACPPPPYCTMDMLMCERAFTPTDDQGCVTGCQQCPPSPSPPAHEDRKSPNPPPSPPPRENLKSPNPPVNTTQYSCDNLIGALTVSDPKTKELTLEETGEMCHMQGDMMYHGMWAPTHYDSIESIPWIDSTKLPCATEWFVSGDLICYCPCEEVDVNMEPPRPFDPIAPSPHEEQKSPSPPPPREEQKSPSPPPHEDQKSPSPPPPHEDKKSPSPPPPREDQKSPSPPPPREDKKSPSPRHPVTRSPRVPRHPVRLW